LGEPELASPAPTPPAPRGAPVTRCLNCNAVLNGVYCSECGQRMQLRRLTTGALFNDFLHELTDLDSRLWRTLIALLTKPGKLTNEFIAGRRTFYLPPFRLYLILSLIFFLLPSIGGPDDLVIEGPGKAITESAPTPATGEPKPAEPKSPAAPDAPAIPGPNNLLEGQDCSDVHTDLFGGSAGWLQPRLVQVCERLKTVSAQQFGHALRNNLPKMMFIFLPLIALVNLVLYVFRRRTYVEHLLFYVHYHAFAFLLITLQITVTALFKWLHVSFIPGLLTFAAYLYLFVYLFKAMRAVYHQSRAMTALKYMVVLISYGVCLLITWIGMAAYTAFTV
jgi:Protein of unknown function (DUF3667)